MSRLQLAVQQIQDTRDYTLRMLDTIPVPQWFWQPHERVTHVAWQVAHLAMAEYFLCLVRVRGQRPDDETIIPPAFLKQYGRESVPNPDPAQNTDPAEIRATLDRVHRQTLTELVGLSDESLDETPHRPHPLFNTKLGALLWCARHEMSHVGQIGLLRRMMGQPPMW